MCWLLIIRAHTKGRVIKIRIKKKKNIDADAVVIISLIKPSGKVQKV